MASTKRKPRYPKLDLSKAYRGNPEIWHHNGVDFEAAKSSDLQLDSDVSAWLQSLGKRARTDANSILRKAMKAAKEEGLQQHLKALRDPAMRVRSVPYSTVLMEQLSDPSVATGYLIAARRDSPEAYTTALRDVAKALRVNPVQLAVPLAPKVATWLLSMGKRAPSRVNSILQAAMKVASKEGK